MKKLKLILPVIALALFSCDNYMDINSPSPNDLAFSQASPSKLLPGAQVSAFRVQATTMNQLGNVFMNAWTRNVMSFGNGFDRELQLQIDNGFYNGIWDGLFVQLKNFDAIIKYPNASHKYDLYVAAAKICKAHYMSQIVDLYGDAPYSEAWQGNANLTPKYDDDYAIYKALIAELEDARSILGNYDPAVAEDFTPYDVMLKGDTAKWIEFANTLELRMCLRMSACTGAKATYRDSKLADLSTIINNGGSFLSANVVVNPVFSADSNAQQNPAWGYYSYDASGTILQNRTFICMTGHAYKSLQSYATTNWAAFGNNYEIVPGSGINYPNVTDPRSATMFTAGASGAPRRAVTQGSSVVDVTTPTGSLTGLALPCRVGLSGNFNPYNQAATTGYDGIDGFVMTKSEANFLAAEAALRYPSLFNDPQGQFEAGITDNFAMRNVTVGPAAYLTAINAKANFGWTGTDTQKLHAIMYQKWIALMGVNNSIQSYIDYNRTGFPVTPMSTIAVNPRKPYRLIYPVSEYVANSANVPSVSTSEIYSVNSKTPFWVPGAP
jgi:hypothetical protein